MLWRAVCHSSFYSKSTAQMRRMMPGSFRKILTKSARRFTSLFKLSIALVVGIQILVPTFGPDSRIGV